MTGLDRNQTPKTRPMPQKRTALVASLDIGTSKIACMIARLKPCPPSDALRGRSHAVELIGYSQIQSHGVKAGAVVDLAGCEQAVRQAVALAERMAKVRVESVLLSVSGGRLHGQLIEAAADIRGGAVTSAGVTVLPRMLAAASINCPCSLPPDTGSRTDSTRTLAMRSASATAWRTACSHSARSTTAPAFTPRDWIWL